ncbi:MAG: hypothetical protein H7Z10_06915 [Gemmatimonadaceae bacterium]|nr:hypothetical protein [Acetobacteraceae bacterium]
MGGFTVGVLAYRASGWPAAAGLLRRTGLAAAALLALLAGMAWGVPDAVLYPLLPVLVVALQVGRGPLRTMLVARPMRGLGALSYALYLVHYPILDAIPPGLASAPARFVLFLAVSFAVAALAYVAIERPGRRALRLAGLAVGAQVGRALPG